MPYSLYHVCQQQFRWIINLLNKFKHKCQKFFESEIIWRCHLVPWDCPVISRLIKNEIIFGRHGYIQTASKSVTNQIFFLIMWLRSVLIMTVWTEQITWNLMFEPLSHVVLNQMQIWCCAMRLRSKQSEFMRLLRHSLVWTECLATRVLWSVGSCWDPEIFDEICFWKTKCHNPSVVKNTWKSNLCKSKDILQKYSFGKS